MPRNRDRSKDTTLTDFGNRINVTFVDKDGNEVKLQVAEGDNLLDIAQANDLEMEGMLSRALEYSCPWCM